MKIVETVVTIYLKHKQAQINDRPTSLLVT